MSILHALKRVVAISFLCTLAACASKVPKATLPSNADPSAEIDRLDRDLQVASTDQVNIAAPKNYHEAEIYRDKAKKERADGDAQAKILDSVAQARGYLNEASVRAKDSKDSLMNVFSAREDARTAGAEKYKGAEFAAADKDFKDVAESTEKNGGAKISEATKSKLQQRYLDIELASIKSAHLSQAQNLIESAEKEGAKKYAPKTLTSATDQFKAAETAITNDRHNNAVIADASSKATAAAEHLLKITRAAKNAKGSSPEDVALRMDEQQTQSSNVIADKEAALATTSAELNETQAQVEARNRALASQREKTSALMGANTELTDEMQKQQKFEKSFQEARQAFAPNEADVLRQGDNLIIRLKSLNFASGHAELNGESFSVLNKVKDVLANMNAEKVVVEGHTDSVGGKSLNQKLSEERAKSVANYIASTDVVAKDQITSEGFGYEKPLASNKTKEGRMQNRRVDLVITPEPIDAEQAPSSQE